MSARAQELQARREALLARSASLRDELELSGRDLGQRWRGLDRGLAFARSGLVLPAVIGGGLLVLAVRPSGLLKLAGRALLFWPVVKPLVPIVRRVVSAVREGRAAP